MEQLEKFPQALELQQWCRGLHDRLLEDFLVAYELDLFLPWPEKINPTENWKTAGVKWQGKTLDVREMKTLHGICEHFGDMVWNAGYSLMLPNCEITPHQGYTGDVLRFHYPLVVPVKGDCAMAVDGEIFNWTLRDALLFDDTKMHSAWNRTGEIRLIVLMDLRRETICK